jgi:eukaryotic-like serine/threonine-protein kinase
MRQQRSFPQTIPALVAPPGLFGGRKAAADSQLGIGAPLGSGAPLGAEQHTIVGGRYELVRPLRQAEDHALWVAHDCDLDIQVAVKIVRHAARDSRAVEAVVREARLAARIEHSAVVRVLDVGITQQGDPFVVRELLSGESLAERLARSGPLPPLDAVSLLLPIAAGLREAHALGIVHRDVRPATIFLAIDRAGKLEPKIVDFGFAKLEARIVPMSRSITRFGDPIGAPGYRAPEQEAGLPGVDHRADVWSLCAVLGELLIGQLPYEAMPPRTQPWHANDYGGIRASLGVVAGSELASIVRRGLMFDPEARFRDMHELGAALAQWLASRGIREDASGRSLESTFPAARSSLPAVTTAGNAPPLTTAGISPGVTTAGIAPPSFAPATLGVLSPPAVPRDSFGYDPRVVVHRPDIDSSELSLPKTSGFWLALGAALVFALFVVLLAGMWWITLRG